MSDLDDAIRRAVRHSMMDTAVPNPPRFIREPASIHRPEPRRWVTYVAAALALALLCMGFVGRGAFAELENTVSAALRFFAVDTSGQLHPIESQSLTLDEALQTQAFRVVAPMGLPPRATLQSIQRLGAGPSTLVIFDYLYDGKSFSMVESPATATSTGNMVYSRGPIPPMGENQTFHGDPGMRFRMQATVWIAGSARVELFAANALAPDEIARVERAMQRV